MVLLPILYSHPEKGSSASTAKQGCPQPGMMMITVMTLILLTFIFMWITVMSLEWESLHI